MSLAQQSMSLAQQRAPRARNADWRAAIFTEDAPELWQRVMHAAESCSVRRALGALRSASPEEVDEARRGTLGLITPVVRALGARGKHPKETDELLDFVHAALQHGFSPDASAPQVMAWEIASPPLVTAASYGFSRTCEALLRAGATPTVRNSDGMTALHSAVEHPNTLALLLNHNGFAALVRDSLVRQHGSSVGLTPFVAALTAAPFKPVHRASAMAMAPHVLLSDDELAALRVRRRVPLLLRLVREHAVARREQRMLQHSSRRHDEALPADATRWHPAWHWSFPESDRAALSLLYHAGGLPAELWARIFRHIERGWFPRAAVAT